MTLSEVVSSCGAGHDGPMLLIHGMRTVLWECGVDHLDHGLWEYHLPVHQCVQRCVQGYLARRRHDHRGFLVLCGCYEVEEGMPWFPQELGRNDPWVWSCQ